ncbi:MAG: NAD(+) synthase [Bacteroidota bacterium]|nr:NAD(+) synthase [Bacteroidota bacterium]
MAHSTFAPDAVARHIVSWLQAYLERSGMDGWVVGVSGGIDSAVTSTLCALTGAPTTCVEMPIHQAPDQVNRAAEHIEDLCARHPRVRRSTVSLTEVYDVFASALPDGPDESGGLAMANSRARLRMTTLYALGQRTRSLVAGTGNKVEDFGVGFYTKYGDGGVDISPIADLTKTEVFALAAYLGVIEVIQQAAPTDGLWGDDRTDEDQLGASYPELEWAMAWEDQHASQSPEERASVEEALPWRQQEVLAIYRRHHNANRHKMIPIPVCEVPDEVRFASA